MSQQVWAGVEVSAKTLLLAWALEDQRPTLKEFPNTPRGHQALTRQLTRQKHSVRVCLESTGVYGLDLAVALDAAAGVEVMQANPRAVRRFAEARFQRQKTDAHDARLLVEFVRRMPFQRWQRPAVSALELRVISRRIETLKDTMVAEKNRRHALAATETTPAGILAITDRTISQMEESIAELRQMARTTIDADPQLARRFELLVSVRGIGERSAITLLGELAVLAPDLDARQWAALAGLAPRLCQSGSSVYRRRGVGHAGNKYLKRALFMPALTAIRFVPELRDFRDRLISRGLKHIQAVVAVMRKLLHIVHALFRDDRAFQLLAPAQRKTAV
ncbi:MAG: IS110 family transposase [Thermoleophilia bacterium]|nr:IS110 family transposase [Thermoleophilia bacterium]